MNRHVLIATVLMLSAVFAVTGCKSSRNSGKSPVPTSSTVKPEIVPSTEVSTVTPSGDDSVKTPDFSGTPHDLACKEDHLGLGMGLLEQGNVDGAIVELEKGVFDEPDSFEIRKTLASAYLKKHDLEDAVGNLRAAVDSTDDGDTWTKLGQVYFDLKDFDSSIKSMKHASKVDPTSSEPWRVLARCYMSKGMWKESIDASEEAIARGSDSPWTYNNLGYAYLVLGQYDDATRELEKAVSFDTGVTPQIWNNLGLSYEKKGQLADSASAYRAALAGGPKYVKAIVNLGRVTMIAKRDGIPIGEMKAEVDPTELNKTVENPTVPSNDPASGEPQSQPEVVTP